MIVIKCKLRHYDVIIDPVTVMRVALPPRYQRVFGIDVILHLLIQAGVALSKAVIN